METNKPVRMGGPVVVIVNYGMGNLGSILNMVRMFCPQSVVTSDPQIICKADKIILPGVGAFDAAISKINQLGLRAVLEERAFQGHVPFLGICLGMQIMMDRSDEGSLGGLGWIPGHVSAFRKLNLNGLRVPHMGWAPVTPVKKDPLLKDYQEGTRFYFAHSFFVTAENNEDVLMRANHGVSFDAIVGRGNIRGVQFHPEKSHKFGKWLLLNFLNM